MITVIGQSKLTLGVSVNRVKYFGLCTCGPVLDQGMTQGVSLRHFMTAGIGSSHNHIKAEAVQDEQRNKIYYSIAHTFQPKKRGSLSHRFYKAQQHPLVSLS